MAHGAVGGGFGAVGTFGAGVSLISLLGVVGGHCFVDGHFGSVKAASQFGDRGGAEPKMSVFNLSQAIRKISASGAK